MRFKTKLRIFIEAMARSRGYSSAMPKLINMIGDEKLNDIKNIFIQMIRMLAQKYLLDRPGIVQEFHLHRHNPCFHRRLSLF